MFCLNKAHQVCANYRLCLTFFTALLVAALWLRPDAFAETEQRELKTETIDQVDAVLLMDSSGSMLQTDPQRLRDEGAKLLLQFLRPGDRIAVMRFDRNAELIRPFSEFKREDVQSIAADVSKIRAQGEYTDLLAGVKAAGELLKKEKRPDAASIIVLLSDGKMEPDPGVGLSRARTEELLNAVLPDLKAAGIKTHTLALSELADRQLLSEISVGTDGVNWFTPDADKIHQSFADLFLVVKKPQVLPLTSKGFSVDADVQEATFYVNHEEGVEVSLLNPDGKEFRYGQQGESIKWFRGKSFDVITINAPKAGDWKVKGLVSADGFATVLTNLKLVSDWPSAVTAGEPALLQARLNEGDKPVVLKEMSGATRYALQILPTDKVAEPTIEDILYDDGTHGDKIANDGIFSFKVLLEEAGDYKMWIVAKGPTFDRRQQIPFRVKPPLVSVKIESGEVEHAAPAAHTKGHHDAHAPAEHDSAVGDSAASGHDEHAPAESPDGHAAEEAAVSSAAAVVDRIIVELSQEAALYKNPKVTMTAIDSDRRRYNIPVEMAGDNLRYEASAKYFPHTGVYELQATFTAESKKKGAIREASRPIKYDYERPEGDENSEIVEVVVDKKIPVEEGSSGIPHALLVFVLNLAVGGGLMMQLKKLASRGSFVVPKFETLDVALAGISELEARNALHEIDFGDPILQNEVISPVSPGVGSITTSVTANATEGGEATPEAAPEAPSESPTEAEATGEEPTTENTPPEEEPKE